MPKVCNEWSLVEVSPGRVLAHIRHGHRWEDSEPDIAGTHRDELGTNYTLETWSDDGCDTPPPSGPPAGFGAVVHARCLRRGLTWSTPTETPIQGHPHHLLKLKDGRILCSYGAHSQPEPTLSEPSAALSGANGRLVILSACGGDQATGANRWVFVRCLATQAGRAGTWSTSLC